MARKKHEKTAFGAYLVRIISETGMSQAEFIRAVGLSRPYFYDLLKGSPPPQEMLEKMLGVLEKSLPPDEKRRTEFYDRAAADRGEIPCDISEVIREHPESWDRIRSALHAMFAV